MTVKIKRLKNGLVLLTIALGLIYFFSCEMSFQPSTDFEYSLLGLFLGSFIFTLAIYIVFPRVVQKKKKEKDTNKKATKNGKYSGAYGRTLAKNGKTAAA